MSTAWHVLLFGLAALVPCETSQTLVPPPVQNARIPAYAQAYDLFSLLAVLMGGLLLKVRMQRRKPTT
ncbi:MAG: hypothetical protein HXY34_07805 [Candidatus Thorarchaeota archaeon]|nr:hypothetical protein [Candidatus Thorarchaeota archaeon]